MRRYALLVTLTASTIALCSSCDKGSPPATSPTTTSAATTSASTTTAKAATREPDAGLTKALRDIVANCEVDDRYGYVKGRTCKNEEHRALIKTLRATEPVDAIATLAHWLDQDDDAKLSALSAATLYARVQPAILAIAKDPAQLDDAVFERLVTRLKALSDQRAYYATRTTVHLAMLKKRPDVVWSIFETHTNPNVRYEALRYAMTYGRLAAFEKVKAIAAASRDTPAVLTAALQAPRNMNKPTDVEREATCGWGKGFLEHRDANVVGQASMLLARCGGAQSEALIALGRKKLKQGGLSIQMVRAFRDVCPFLSPRLNPRDKDAQALCEANEAFLREVVAADNLAATLRAEALWGVYYQRRDKGALELAKKYQKATKAPELSARANDIVKTLSQRLQADDARGNSK